MIRSPLYDHPQGSSFVLSAVTAFPLVCFVHLFVRYVAVCCLCVCVSVVPACGMTTPEDGHIVVTETCRFFNNVF
jgi:hypothetical protein